MKAVTATLALLLSACSPAPVMSSSFGPGGVTGASTSEAETTAAASTSSGEAGDASTSGGVDAASTGTSAGGVPDLGSAPDLGGPAPEGCDGKKIDFMFVISNSNTMEPSQQKLLAAFPGFIDAIESRDIDKHILVTTSLPMWRMSDCAYCEFDCNDFGEPPECGAQLTECDSMLGAGYTYPGGKGASNRRCELAGGRRYITDEEPDVTAAFKCLATVGIDGSNNWAVDAVRAALDEPLNAGGACNEGFLRDDALLVVSIITDTGDVDSIGPVEAWVKDILAAKGGDPDAVYLFIITTDTDLPGHLCWPDEPWVEEPGRYRKFVNMMPHASMVSICGDSYAPYFDAALGTILELCASFVPR